MVCIEFYDVVEKRRSIRKYSNSPIETEKLYRILQSATLAPSWSCKHCWRFIIIDDDEIKNNLVQCINETNPVREGILGAPMAVVMCGDPSNTEEIDEKEYYMADCGIAMEHFMLAAACEELSTCWVGIFDEDMVKSVLDIPESVRIVALSPIGYADEIPDERVKKSIKDITYHNKWEKDMVFQ